MTTKLIGIKDFRQNMNKYYEAAKTNNWQYIILKRNQPIFSVTPLSDDDEWSIIDDDIEPEDYMSAKELEELEKQIAIALEQVKNGEVYTADEIRKELGL